MKLFIIAIILFMLNLIILYFDKKYNKNNNLKKINFSNYQRKFYVMTQAELQFYRKIKTITDNLELSIFPQIQLEKIIETKNNNNADRNRIKSRTIDFTIVNNKNCKIICCIELDDYTHNYKNRIKRDEFINELFIKTNLKLYRYDLNTDLNIIEKNIKECL